LRYFSEFGQLQGALRKSSRSPISSPDEFLFISAREHSPGYPISHSVVAYL